MFAAVPLCVALFAVLPARRAVLATYILTWLFLPMAAIDLPGVPAYTKFTAAGLAAALGVVLFDARRLGAFRFKLIDAPMAVWCLSPLASSLSNGLGLYDGVAASLEQFIQWGLPYFFGRLYFTDRQGVRELAIGLLIAGLIYMPFCLWEIRMSPRLHSNIYGFRQHMFQQTQRFGGWRPMVFLQHGLAVGMLMTSASLVGVWLWRSGSLRRVRLLNPALLIPPLVVTTILCKSALAIVLLFIGLGVMYATTMLRTRMAAAVLLCVPLLFIGGKLSGVWEGQELVTAARLINPVRAESIATRVESERVLIDRAKDRIVFGWGGYGRNTVVNERDRYVAIPDSLWVIALGQRGIVGLSALVAALLLPAWLVIRRAPPSLWATPLGAPAAALAMVVLLHLLDSLFNAMQNPLFLFAAGGVAAAMAKPAIIRASAGQRAARQMGRSNAVSARVDAA